MLEIILVASGAFLAAMFCVWVYRISKNMHDAKFRQVKLSGQEKSLNVARESGTVDLNRMGGSRATLVSANGSRKPWGW